LPTGAVATPYGEQSVTMPAFDQEVQQMVINRVGPLSAAKIAGTLYAMLGLIFGAIISMIALAGGMATNSDDSGPAAMGAIFGAGAVILLPIFYGCLGFLMTLLMTALFNVTARMVGGVQIDVS
jgi:hypothetical protein